MTVGTNPAFICISLKAAAYIANLSWASFVALAATIASTFFPSDFLAFLSNYSIVFLNFFLSFSSFFYCLLCSRILMG